MKYLFVFIALISSYTYAQNINTEQLDSYFSSLEHRNEAMGSIAISKNGKLLYSNAIGYKTINGNDKEKSTTATHYKIWSITKTYTAVMIFQLIEEGKLSLDTTLNTFYPQIPNSKKITIRQMLCHRSGIFDYVNDIEKDINLRDIQSKDSIAELIGTFTPNFKPGENFRYSNSNYLFLGYIIETLDSVNFETALSNRILSKLKLRNTYFGTQTVKNLKNIANTYNFNGSWIPVDGEADYNNHIETADGGIVATMEDMALFIEALFDGKLISEQSLSHMLEGTDSYRLGIMKTQFLDSEGFGHTGGWISESSLFYYPKDELTIAYATNGIVIRKEEILDNVLKIYHNKPFAVSMNRNVQGLVILIIGLLCYSILRFRFSKVLTSRNLIYLGFITPLIFWIGSFISGLLRENYNYISEPITALDAFYSSSGTFMASIQFATALLSILFFLIIYKNCKRHQINVIPAMLLLFVPIAMIGASLFPFPNKLYSLFANIIILNALSPITAIFLWRKSQISGIRRLALLSIFLTIVSICLIALRSVDPEFVFNYMGIIQRILYLGWSLWFVFLTLSFQNLNKKRPS